jgi:hypothetical protein
MRAQIFVCALLILFASCSKNSPSYDHPYDNKIGDQKFGGIFFYVYNFGQHGLVAARNDIPNDMPWVSRISDLLRLDLFSKIGSGSINTGLINMVYSNRPADSSYAAMACTLSSLDGFNDWYLPSKDELNELYKQRDVVGGFVQGDSTNNFLYWSSTNSDTTTAWAQSFYDGVQVQENKRNGNNIRPIRSF